MSTLNKIIGFIILALGAGAIVGLSIAMSACIDGWVLMKLWAWFVVPLFRLPALTLLPAIGLSLVVSFLTFQVPPFTPSPEPDAKQNTTNLEALGEAMVNRPLFVLGFGWVVHLLMR